MPNRSTAFAARRRTADSLPAALSPDSIPQNCRTTSIQLYSSIFRRAGVRVWWLSAAGGAAAAVCAVRGGAAGAVGRHPHAGEHHRCAPPCGGSAAHVLQPKPCYGCHSGLVFAACGVGSTMQLVAAEVCDSHDAAETAAHTSFPARNLERLLAEASSPSAHNQFTFSALHPAGALRRGLRAEDLIGYMRERAHPRVAARTPIVPEVPSSIMVSGGIADATSACL